MSDQRIYEARLDGDLMKVEMFKQPPVLEEGEYGGYWVPDSFLRPFKHLCSIYDRRDAKKRRRYQHQKRKQ